MMADLLRIGIVGCGLIGRKRAAVIHDDPRSQLCCAADLDAIGAYALLKEYGGGEAGAAFQDWQVMLDKEKIDALIVAVPNKYLKKIALQAAARKIHVLCEKPLGRNAWESGRMVKVAREKGSILKTGFNHRFHPAIWKAHELAAAGEIGPIHYLRCVYGHGGRPGYEKEWRASKDICGGGELLDQGVHVVDLFRWFLGNFEEAFGYTPTCYWNMEVEDNAFALFRTAKGQTAQMHTSWTQWKNRFTFEIFGEAGYLIVEGLGGSYGVERLTIGKRPRKTGMGLSPISYLGGVPEEETLIFDGPDVSWEREWKEFTAAIREGREPLGNGSDGLEANRMLEAVYQSARENRPVKICAIK
jgi:predicted dehydrogenase